MMVDAVSATGIGRATADALADEGCDVIVTGRRENELKTFTRGRHVVADLSKRDQIERLYEEVGDRLDIVVNCAGVAPFAGILNGKFEDFQQLLEVNVLGLTYSCQLAVKKFDPEDGGQIVNVSSMSGHRVPPTGGFYAATKFAVRAVTEALRCELRNAGNPTRSACISPGFVDTPLLDTYFKGKEDNLSALKGNIRMLAPIDIAEAIIGILKTPPHVEVTDVLLRPSDQKT